LSLYYLSYGRKGDDPLTLEVEFWPNTSSLIAIPKGSSLLMIEHYTTWEGRRGEESYDDDYYYYYYYYYY
jgi:hypothetical protein